MNQKEYLLADIAFDPGELINVRAHATCLFVAKVGKIPSSELDEELKTRLEKLSCHSSLSIRLGVVLGYGEIGDLEKVSKFISDPNPVVQKEAKEILEDAQF